MKTFTVLITKIIITGKLQKETCIINTHP
uniref:Uncharacterized protein n=1 Tax=Tetranychus urticae TaxID=32264 RepID=T1L2G0_TETUR